MPDRPDRLPATGAAKRALDAAAALLVLPMVGTYRLAARLAPGRARELFQGFSQLLSLAPGTGGNFLRRAFYRRTLRRCSADCIIGFGTILSTPNAEIGRHVYVGARCTLGRVVLGDDVLLGSNVDLLSGKRQHSFDRLDVPIRLQGGRFDRITVGRDVWIGNGAVVADDVGEQAVVAAGAVVVKPVPPRAVVGGNPARVIAERGADRTCPPAVAPPQPVEAP